MSNTNNKTSSESDLRKHSLEGEESSAVDSFLESRRKKIKSSLTSDDNNKNIEDLDYMLKSVRAIINIINETWERCKEYRTAPLFTFQIATYEKVKVVKSFTNLSFTTRQVLKSKNFGFPPVVPEDLKKLVFYNEPDEENDIFPDYNEYLDRSAILCKEMLLPFLTGFQEHLKETHVYVGKIETWLMQPEENIKFLNQLFGLDSKVLTNEASDNTQSTENPYNEFSLCIRCFKGRAKHNSRNEKLFCSDRELSSFSDDTVKILYESHTLIPDGHMDWNIDLYDDEGRNRLETLLTFAKTFKPVSQVVVSDAGEESVHGIYTINGVEGGVAKFTREGQLNGQTRTFTLLRESYTISNNEKFWIWFINIISKDGNDNHTPYYAQATGNEYELPPKHGWKSRSAKSPAPELSFIR